MTGTRHRIISNFSGYMKIRASDSPVLKCKGFSFVVNNEGSLVKLLDPMGRVRMLFISSYVNL